jgi:hypothetical protein
MNLSFSAKGECLHAVVSALNFFKGGVKTALYCVRRAQNGVDKNNATLYNILVGKIRY